MEKTPMEVFDNPIGEEKIQEAMKRSGRDALEKADLIRAGIMPITGDPETLVPEVLKHKQDDEKRIQVSARLHPATAKVITQIVQQKVFPNITTMQDALAAAATLWVQLVEPRINQDGLTGSWRAYRAVARIYESAMARVRTIRSARDLQSSAEMHILAGDVESAKQAVEAGWTIMEDLGIPRGLEFERRVLEKSSTELRDLWVSEGDKTRHDSFQRERYHYIEEQLEGNAE